MVTSESDETDRVQEGYLFSEIESLLAFEGTTAREILNSMPFVYDPNEIALDSEENLRLELSQDIQNIKTSYEIMKNSIPTSPHGNSETEYWGVLIGADMNEPVGNWNILKCSENAELMAEILPISDNWQKNHILTLSHEEVSLANITLALLWLDLMEDEDDISFIYYTAHGYFFPYDLPPIDEPDGKDAVSYTHLTLPTN